MLPTTVRIKRLPHYAHWTAQQSSIRDIVYGVLLLFDCQSHSSPGAINSYLRLISFPPRHGRTGCLASMRGCTQNRQLIPTPGPANTREGCHLIHGRPSPRCGRGRPVPLLDLRRLPRYNIQSAMLPFVINCCRVRTCKRAGTPCGHLHEGRRVS